MTSPNVGTHLDASAPARQKNTTRMATPRSGDTPVNRVRSARISILLALLLAATLSLASCSDGSSIGNSLADESVSIVVDSAFTLSGSSRPNPVVQSRTLSQLIGAVDAPGFGVIRSDFVGQFMPSLALDTADIVGADLDSLKLFMQLSRGNFVGDSLAPMGLTAYRLTRDLPYPIFSDFNPEGYYDPSSPLASTVFIASTIGESDSLQALPTIYATLPLPVSLGSELLAAYRANPSAFADPEVFARDVFKGLYIQSSFGSGRIADFSASSLRFYFNKRVYNADSARYDTIPYVGDYFAVTPEVVINNDISLSVDPSLAALADSAAVIAAPVGYEVVIRFPAPEVIAAFRSASDSRAVLNTLTLSIPAEQIPNPLSIAPPPYVLLVLESEKDEFFASNSLADGRTSFYAAYDDASSSYSFSSLRQYLLDLLDKGADISPADYTFVLTPVQVNMEESAGSYYYGSSMVESSIVPYVSKPAMAKILLDKAKIKLTFSTDKGKLY